MVIPVCLFLYLNLKQLEQEPTDFRIQIHSDTDFMEYGFPGNGSVENPYRIENFTISTSHNYGIYIYNVTKHFVIRNNDITAEQYGIFISRVSDNITRIETNIIHDCDCGIRVYYAKRNLIYNNNFYNNGVGISLSLNSDYSVIANNRCYQEDGTSIFNYRNPCVIIENNSLIFKKEMSFRIGIALYSPINNTIRYNYLENCGFEIYFENYAYWDTLLLKNNYLNGEPFNYKFLINEHNISVNSSDYHQLSLLNCSNIEIFDGNFRLVNYGISLRNCSNITIRNSYFTHMGGIGVSVEISNNVTICNSNITYSYRGISTGCDKNLLITNCSFFKCNTGCYLTFSDVFLINNTFNDNLEGCSLSACGYEPHALMCGIPIDYNCTLIANKFFNNTIGCYAFESICVLRENMFNSNDISLYMKGWDAIAYITKTECNIINNKFISNYISVKMELSNGDFVDNYFGYNRYGIYYSLDSWYWLNNNTFENNEEDLFLDD